VQWSCCLRFQSLWPHLWPLVATVAGRGKPDLPALFNGTLNLVFTIAVALVNGFVPGLGGLGQAGRCKGAWPSRVIRLVRINF